MGISKDVPTEPCIQNLNLKSKILDRKFDIRNLGKFEKEFKNLIQILFSFAAQSLVKKSFLNPYLTWTSNTLGTINLLEILRKLKEKKKIVNVIITSDKSYKNIEVKRGYVESDRLGGFDPYSASKASAELALQSYINSFYKKKKNNLILGIARAGNVIGGGDWSDDRLIPDCVKSWSKNKTAIIRNPKSTRPWQHVIEAVYGYLILAKNLNDNLKINGEVFNFGPRNKKNFTVIDLIKKFEKNWNKIKWKVVKERNNKESKLLRINSNKAMKILKRCCILYCEEMTKYLSDWYRFYYNKKSKMSEITIDQIKAYEKKLRRIK